VIREAPIDKGSNIQSASDVPTRAHWVLFRISCDSGPRARSVSSHGATPAIAGSDASADQAVGRAKRATIAGAGEIFPTPTTNSIPFGIAAGPDGQLWFVERNADNIGSIPTSATSGAAP
jgi:hypothetical protein